MPKVQTYKASDLEKRFKLLQMQLYGKQEKITSSKYQVSRTTNYQLPTTDVTFLKQDLIKIAILTSLAIGAQLILYFSQLPSRLKLF